MAIKKIKSNFCSESSGFGTKIRKGAAATQRPRTDIGVRGRPDHCPALTRCSPPALISHAKTPLVPHLIASGQRGPMANAIELLDNLLRPEIKRAVLPCIESLALPDAAL